MCNKSLILFSEKLNRCFRIQVHDTQRCKPEVEICLIFACFTLCGMSSECDVQLSFLCIWINTKHIMQPTGNANNCENGTFWRRSMGLHGSRTPWPKTGRDGKTGRISTRLSNYDASIHCIIKITSTKISSMTER